MSYEPQEQKPEAAVLEEEGERSPLQGRTR
jgi:hypothetical protein